MMAGVAEICTRAVDAAPAVAGLSAEVKNAALGYMATALEERSNFLVEANAEDIERAKSEGVSSTLVDRLRLTDGRISAMADGLRSVAAQPDPVGEVVEGWKRPNGLLIERVRVPLGVVAVIYEARPNVTADVAGLCLKSGNACVLRGSSIATSSNNAIAHVLRAGAARAGAPEDAIQLVGGTDRSSAVDLMQAKGYIDLLVPRGGADLIQIDRRERHGSVHHRR